MRIMLTAFIVVGLAAPVLAQTAAPAPGAVPPGAAPAMPGTPGTPGAPGPSAPSAGARPPHGQRMTLAQRFAAANTTNDGKLTLEQAKAAGMQRIVRNFDRIDAQHKGYVTLDEIRAAARASRAANPSAPRP